MIVNLGTVKPGSTIYVPFHTYDSNDPSASVTITGLAVTDIEIYKDGSTTQRASDAGYTLLDTDGIDFDTVTGIHGFSIDLADNTTAGFWAAGSKYFVVVASITVDAATINFIPVMFEIGYPDAILNTTIATLASQTSFTLTAGSADNDAYNGCVALVHDVASGIQIAMGYVLDYVGSTKTVTLAADPGIFTMAATDNISLFVPSNVTAWQGTSVTTSATSAKPEVDTFSISDDATAANNAELDYDGTGYNKANSTIGTTTTNTDMRGTDNAALASVLGALADAAAAGDPTATDTVIAYVKQLINVLVGTTGVTTYPAAAAPANNVSLAEILRAIYDDTNSLDGTKVPDTISLANINAEVDTAFTTQMADSTVADGSIPTREQALLFLTRFLEERGVSGTTMTVYKEDGLTAVATFTLDDGTNPTSITRAT